MNDSLIKRDRAPPYDVRHFLRSTKPGGSSDMGGIVLLEVLRVPEILRDFRTGPSSVGGNGQGGYTTSAQDYSERGARV